MAIDFPSSPTTGQSFQSGNQLWTYNGSGWTTGYASTGYIRQIFTATASQTSFTVTGGYQSGLIDVYQNGVKLVNGTDVTVTSGTAVVLSVGATAGDIIEVIGAANIGGLNYLPIIGGTLTGTLNGTNASFSGTLGVTGAITGSSTIADATGVIRPLVVRTAQATTSGTVIDFTAIPSWVERITVAFAGVSTTGTNPFLVQIGTGGVATTTGYLATSNTMNQASNTAGSSSAAGFVVQSGAAAANVTSGLMTIVNVSGNLWVASHAVKNSTLQVTTGGGDVTLGGVLNFLRLTTVGGTDTFDAGSVNILYE